MARALDSSTIGRGIAAALGANFIFAAQDGITKILTADLAIGQIVMVRFLSFAVFAIIFVSARGDLRQSIRTRKPFLQVLRSALLIGEIMIFALALRYLPLPTIHALFLTFPLMVTALSVPILEETVGWRRWLAVIIGFLGTLIVIRPGLSSFDPAALLMIGSSFVFALYNILTRMVSRYDSFETSTLYTGVVGAIIGTVIGLTLWQWPTPQQWLLLGMLSVTGISGHMLLIKALEWAPAATLQPINFSIIFWGTIFSIVVFSTWPDSFTILGAAIVIASGLYISWRESMRGRLIKR